MPTLAKNVQKGYYSKNSIKSVSKKLEEAVISNYKKQFAELAKLEKEEQLQGGAKRQIKVFDKKIKQKLTI
jgi:hypothetical protein